MQIHIWPNVARSNASQMLPVLHKHFAIIKQKSENERMEKSTFSLKKP